MTVLLVIEAYVSDIDTSKTIAMNPATAKSERNLIHNVVTLKINLCCEKRNCYYTLNLFNSPGFDWKVNNVKKNLLAEKSLA